MSDPQFRNVGKVADRTIEECSELIKELCKARRFGWDNWHPKEPKKLNVKRVYDEIQDVKSVIDELEMSILKGPYEVVKP